MTKITLSINDEVTMIDGFELEEVSGRTAGQARKFKVVSVKQKQIDKLQAQIDELRGRP